VKHIKKQKNKMGIFIFIFLFWGGFLDFFTKKNGWAEFDSADK
jgi:cytochrome c1